MRGSSTAGVVFTETDITSAVVTNDTTFTITLAVTWIESHSGFAADGIGDTNTNNIDVTADLSAMPLNPAIADGATDPT